MTPATALLVVEPASRSVGRPVPAHERAPDSRPGARLLCMAISEPAHCVVICVWSYADVTARTVSRATPTKRPGNGGMSQFLDSHSQTDVANRAILTTNKWHATLDGRSDPATPSAPADFQRQRTINAAFVWPAETKISRGPSSKIVRLRPCRVTARQPPHGIESGGW